VRKGSQNIPKILLSFAVILIQIKKNCCHRNLVLFLAKYFFFVLGTSAYPISSTVTQAY
jgi:hypothetical protein